MHVYNSGVCCMFIQAKSARETSLFCPGSASEADWCIVATCASLEAFIHSSVLIYLQWLTVESQRRHSVLLPSMAVGSSIVKLPFVQQRNRRNAYQLCINFWQSRRLQTFLSIPLPFPCLFST